jgi:hypothetical protein
MNTLEQLGMDFLRLKAQKDTIEIQMEHIKGEVLNRMYKEGTGKIVLPIDDKFEVVFQNNVRITKSMDKDGLASKSGVSRDELDYEGVANLIYNKRLTPREVGEFQSENTSEFVTIRKRGRTD